MKQEQRNGLIKSQVNCSEQSVSQHGYRLPVAAKVCTGHSCCVLYSFLQPVYEALQELQDQHQNDRAEVKDADARHKSPNRVKKLVHESIHPSSQGEIRRYEPGHYAVKQQQ